MTAAGKLNVLYVAYPLLPVNESSAGGAEQMLSTLDREMTLRGHRTVVAASEGSAVAGDLFSTGFAPEETDKFEDRDVEHSTRVVEFVWQRRRAGQPFDLVHDQSGHFWKHASALSMPVLATLHLPRGFYRAELFTSAPENLFFNCVSESQAPTFTDLPRMLGVVQNGINLWRFPVSSAKDDYLLWMGRICEEKGAHVAIDIARHAGASLMLAGQVYPFSYHQAYFTREIVPRLNRASTRMQFVQSPSFADKLRLLQRARALVITSLVDETSSLVAMEAMACGTPVVAFRRGALPEVVADGETGFLVDTPDQMVEALARVGEINGERCRQRVESAYSAVRMASDYESLYRRVLRAAPAEEQALLSA